VGGGGKAKLPAPKAKKASGVPSAKPLPPPPTTALADLSSEDQGRVVERYAFMIETHYKNSTVELDWAMRAGKAGAYEFADTQLRDANARIRMRLQEQLAAEEAFTALANPTTTAFLSALAELAEHSGQSHLQFRNPGECADCVDKMKTLRAQLRQPAVAALFPDAMVAELEACVSDATAKHVLRRLTARVKELQDHVEQVRTGPARASAELEKATGEVEKWSARIQAAHDFAEKRKIAQHKALKQMEAANQAALRVMRGLIPPNVGKLTVPEIMSAARAAGGLLTVELATRFKTCGPLKWLVMTPEEIADQSTFTQGAEKASFQVISSLDMTELRAVVHVLPDKFNYDFDGSKAAWSERATELLILRDGNHDSEQRHPGYSYLNAGEARKTEAKLRTYDRNVALAECENFRFC
jgi:hypothetical protein